MNDYRYIPKHEHIFNISFWALNSISYSHKSKIGKKKLPREKYMRIFEVGALYTSAAMLHTIFIHMCFPIANSIFQFSCCKINLQGCEYMRNFVFIFLYIDARYIKMHIESKLADIKMIAKLPCCYYLISQIFQNLYTSINIKYSRYRKCTCSYNCSYAQLILTGRSIFHIT